MDRKCAFMAISHSCIALTDFQSLLLGLAKVLQEMACLGGRSTLSADSESSLHASSETDA